MYSHSSKLLTFLFVFVSLHLNAQQLAQANMENASVHQPNVDVMVSSKLQVAHLEKGDQVGFEAIRKSFATRNPGYDITYISDGMAIDQQAYVQVAFIQTGETEVEVSSAKKSTVSVGDIIVLRPNEGLKADSLLSMLVFKIPDLPSEDLPTFIRPDWDPNITDIPGGCATETGAYRRILLTWKDKVGKYIYHAINAHRVRIMDSFSHYHPQNGGFDEFYLVQMAMPGAKIITSRQVPLIEQPENVSTKKAKKLLQHTELHVGDLVYLPRGMMHRGVGGVLAQVITVPGFIPGSEIGVDHHLRKINELLKLKGKKAIPYNEAASKEAIVK